MSSSILIISGSQTTVATLKKNLAGLGLGNVEAFHHFSATFDTIYNEIPLIMIVDVFEEKETVSLLNSFKEDPLFTGVPVLAIVDDVHIPVNWEAIHADDYIRRPFIDADIAMRVQLGILRSHRIVEVNPLTRLPGNIAINRQIQNRINSQQPFALAYADLDNFKPFNDKYGFTRGDEVLKITGRLILNIVKGKCSQDSFVGHIGGDDFVFITDPPSMEDVCRDLIDAFDRIIPTFYDPADRKAGFIQSHDREGHTKTFPFLTITIGVVNATGLPFSHYGEVTEIASEMKRYAKRTPASCYSVNRRSFRTQKNTEGPWTRNT
ncbi:MAG TPA: GGDEF domain-containing protein [Syntrophales bacterium]|jgi:diguanylate cyclase (GGDEF)-like protein|nr:GGDEF domain-containing protein [Syntrophales bacterium]